MKKITIIIVAVVLASNVFAQISDIKISDKMTINKVYAGIYSNTNFTLDSLSTTCFTSVRLGVMATYRPVKGISFKYWAICQTETKAIPWTMQQVWVKFDLTPKLSLESGSMATLPTEQRPHPVSLDGHFETANEASIPGMAINSKLKYQITKDLQVAGGIAQRKKMPEYSGRVTYKKFILSGWYSQYDEKFGSALSVDFLTVHTNFVYRQSQSIGNNSTIVLNKKEEIYFYSDIVYELNAEKLVRCELGVFKSFSSKNIKGLVGLGYQNESHSVATYLMVTL